MGYTTAEKRAALGVLTQQDLAFSRNALKGRNTGATYDQLRELVLTSLYYEPDAVFALLDIASNQWAARVASLRTKIAALQSDLSFLLAKDRTFTRLDMLQRAKATLGRARVTAAIQGKVGTRPLERYRRLVEVALTDMARQTVQAGASLSGGGRSIIQARAAAQKSISSDFSVIKTSHANLRDGLDYLLGGYAAYEGADALAQLSASQLNRLDDMVGDVIEALETQTESAARQNMRSYFLNLLSGQAIARRLEERTSASAPRLSALSGYRLTAAAPVSPPTVTGDTCAPWVIEDGATDVLSVDFSGTVVSVDLVSTSSGDTGVQAAEVLGSAYEPFRIVDSDVDPVALLTKKITAGSNYSVNGTNLYLVVDGTPWTVSFVADRTATQVASDINAVAGITVNATPQNSGGQDWVQIDYSNGSPPDRYDDRSVSVVTGASNAADLAPWDLDGPSGAVAGTESRGADARDTIDFYVNDDATPTSVTLTAGAWPDYERTAAEVAGDIATAGGVSTFTASASGGRVIISSSIEGEQSRISMTSDGLSAGAETVSLRTLRELGFIEGLESRDADVSMAQVLGVLNGDTAFAAQGVASNTRQILYEARSAQVTGASTVQFAVGSSDPSTDWDLSLLKVAIHTGGNHGNYTVASKVYSSPNLTLTLDRTLRDQAATNRFSLTVQSERLTITSSDAAAGSYLQVQTAANTAHNELGLSLTLVKGLATNVFVERQHATKGWQPFDLRPSSVRVGDIIDDASGTQLAVVTGVADLENGQMTVTAVDADFSVTGGFVIRSGPYDAYRTFNQALKAWRRTFSSFDEDTLKEIGDLLYPQLRREVPSRDQVAAASTKLSEYDTLLESLYSVLTDYSVSRPAVVTGALRSLEEHGHNRARSLLIQGDFASFFGLTSRGASKSQHLMAQLNDVAAADINESTFFDNGEEGELDRFMIGYEEDGQNPAFEIEDEEQWPESPMSDYPVDPAATELSYTPLARGAKR